MAMKKQPPNHVDRKLSESAESPTRAISGEFVTEMFEYDGGRQVTVYVPPDPPEAIVFAGDGQANLEVGPVAREGRRTVHNDRRCTWADR